jgi:alpha-1,2-mannosyltransferase
MKGLVAFWMASAVLLGGALTLLPAPLNETVWTHTAKVLRAESGDDSWGPMRVGLDHLESGAPGRVYDVVFFERRIKLQYPPTAWLAIVPVRAVARVSGTEDRTILSVLSLAGLAIVAFFTALILAGDAAPSAGGRAVFALAAFGMALTFYPIVKAYSLGQIQVWIDALFAGALWAWMRGRPATAGIALGLITCLKPQFGVLLLWGLLRRQRAFAIAFAATLLLATGVSIAAFGWPAHANYLDVVRFLGRHGEAFHANQSIGGTLHRMLGNGESQEWQHDSFPPYHPWVFAGTAAASALLLLAALARRAAAPGSGGAADLGAMGLAATLASPIAWEHHHGVLLPLYALLLVRRPAARWFLPVLAASYVLTSHLLAFTRMLDGIPWVLAQSYTLWGSLVALALLLALRPRDAVRPAGASTAAPSP